MKTSEWMINNLSWIMLIVDSQFGIRTWQKDGGRHIAKTDWMEEGRKRSRLIPWKEGTTMQ